MKIKKLRELPTGELIKEVRKSEKRKLDTFCKSCLTLMTGQFYCPECGFDNGNR